MALQPTCSSSFLMAPTGAVVNQAGACATPATPAILASGCSLRRLRLARAHQHQRRGAVGDRAGVGGRHRAALAEGGLQLGDLGGVGRERLLVLLHLDRAATRPFTVDRHDLLGERAVLVGLLGALQALDGEGVLRLARELVVLRGILGEGAHQPALVVGVLQAVEEHVVLDLGVAEPGAAAHLGQQVGRVGHALHAAGDDDVRRPRVQRRRRPCITVFMPEPHILLTVVQGTVFGRPAPMRGLPRRRLALAGRQHAAHQHLAHVVRLRRRRARRRP